MRPILSITIDAKSNMDRWKIDVALTQLSQLDTTFSHRTDPESGSVVIAGETERQLRQIIERVLQEAAVTAVLGEPKVIYYESIRAAAQAEGRYIRPSNYAQVRILIEPMGRYEGYEFSTELNDSNFPTPFIHAIDQGIQNAMLGGVLAGKELVNIKATLFDASFHEIQSNEMSFKIAASMALKEAARKAKPVLLEPIMSVEISCPEERMGAVLHDLNNRQARVEEIKTINAIRLIEATAPLRMMLNYEGDIQSLLQTHVTCIMRFSRYEESSIKLP